MRKGQFDLEVLLDVIMHFDIIHAPIIGLNSDISKKVYGLTDFNAGKIYIDPTIKNVQEYLDTHVHECYHGISHLKDWNLTEEEVRALTARRIKEFKTIGYNGNKKK